jgi:hypothetical protein
MAINILVFLHGTSIMHAAAERVSREQRVGQVRDRDPSVHEYRSYVPTPGSVEKITEWCRQGASVAYFSCHRAERDIAADQEVLRLHRFPGGPVYFRRAGESYRTAVERARPDLVIEDDCESIGGASETIAAQLRDSARQTIRRIVLPEFAGFEALPDNPADL